MPAILIHPVTQLKTNIIFVASSMQSCAMFIRLCLPVVPKAVVLSIFNPALAEFSICSMALHRQSIGCVLAAMARDSSSRPP